jgi:short-subunit dehydrogenase involved in D-alanine esterification of teichoic acids
LESKLNSKVVVRKNKKNYSINNVLNNVGIMEEAKVKQKKKSFLEKKKK